MTLRFVVVITAFLVTGCVGTDVADQPAGLPLRYRNAKYGLTFFLPASWRGYSVSIEDLEDARYSPMEDRPIIIGHTPMVTFRHPQWHAGARYQDIPILVFTRAQWDALHHGELWPSRFAGGTMDELWHNRGFVFAMSSRYNWGEFAGMREVASIVEHNRASHKMPRLYSE